MRNVRWFWSPILCLVSFLFVPLSAFALEPPRPGEIEELRKSGEWENRRSAAENLGNHKVDSVLLKRAIGKAKKKALSSQGVSLPDIDSTAPEFAPPPGRAGVPTTGNVKMFALLIDFPDYPHSNSSSAIHSKLFGAGSPVDFPYESLSAYYDRSSYGQLVLSGGSTLGWYRTSYNRTSISMTDTARENVIKEAINYFNGLGHDFSQYDNDGDGDIDYFIVIWTGPDNGWANFWWGYQTWFSDSSWTIDGKKLTKYSWQWEANSWPGVFSPRVVIHETGHALGLPDYYDYDGTVGPKGGVGQLDMMDANWGDHNCFSKWVLDWITPAVVPSGSVDITLNPSGTTQDAVLIMPGIETDDIFSEFFMAQNRFRTGNDTVYPTDGLLIWHVDATLSGSGYDYLYNNSYTSHKLLRLMEADGLEEIEKNLGADAADFYTPGASFGNYSTPSSRSYAGSLTDVAISDIWVNGQNISATISIEEKGHYTTGTTRVSVDGSGNQGNSNSYNASISADGRYVTFDSDAADLVSGDTNGSRDVFVHDRQTGETTRVSVDSSGGQGNGSSESPSISADGRYVSFQSVATNLVTGDTNGVQDIFIHDRQSGETTRVSVNSTGEQVNGYSYNPSISAGGRYVAFQSEAYELAAGINYGFQDIYVHDRQTGETTRVSVNSSGTQGNGSSYAPSISTAGRYVSFQSVATNLVTGDTNGVQDIFVHDRQTGETTRISVDSAGIQGDNHSYVSSISEDGRYVAFYSLAGNLVTGDTNGVQDIFVHDHQTGETSRVSVDSSGAQGNNSSYNPSISADGRYVVFDSDAANLVSGDANGTRDIFVHDRQTGQTKLVSVDSAGNQGNGGCVARSIGADGRYVVYSSNASNLVDGDSNAASDVFVSGLERKPVVFDFDGDRKTDVAVWRSSNGVWYIQRSSDGGMLSSQWGLGSLGDVPVPGDYDGDGKSDVAVWRPSNGVWYIQRSSDGGMLSPQWGLGSLGDVSVPGDYDGDGKTDVAVWRPENGVWYIQRSLDGGMMSPQWGLGSLSDVPVAGDYDGDGKTDVAVWRPDSGVWYIQRSSDGGILSPQWGLGALNDVPVPGDYDGDGKTDVAVWRPDSGVWYIQKSSDAGMMSPQWGSGALNDVAVPGDYDGDGKTDPAVWRPDSGVWYIQRSSDGGMMSPQWGLGALGDIPINSRN